MPLLTCFKLRKIMIWSRNKLLFYRLVNSQSHLVLQWLSYVTVQSRVTTRCVTGKWAQSAGNKVLALLGMFL